MRNFVILFLLLALLALVGTGASMIVRPETGEKAIQSLIDQYDKPADPRGTPVAFTVRPGDGSGRIGEELDNKGIIDNSTIFKLLVSYYGLDKELKAGDYELSPAMTMTEIITKLHQGLVKTTRVTVPEGMRLDEIADTLDRKGIFRLEDIMAAVRASYDYPFLRSRPAGATLEGYLFPDTYELRPQNTAANFVQMMLSNFQERFTPAMVEAAGKKKLSVHQVLTLASIVEREAVVPEERPIIASAFLNRLNQNIPLYADPTVQYALGNDPKNVARWGFWKKDLSQADLNISSPYNTYRTAGIPPGPIANPGLASIKAVLEPADTNFLYFVARGDGSHVFATTLQEHDRNVAKYGGGR